MNETELMLSKLFASYPNTKVGEMTVITYAERLQRIPVGELRTVIDQCLEECKYLPTIAELFERWHLITRRIDVPTAAEAWGSVTNAIRGVGLWGIPKFKDPLVEHMVALMGWEYLCRSEDQMADRAHFLKMYDSIVQRNEQIQRLTPEARHLAEERTGLKPIGDNVAKALPEYQRGANHNETSTNGN